MDSKETRKKLAAAIREGRAGEVIAAEQRSPGGRDGVEVRSQ